MPSMTPQATSGRSGRASASAGQGGGNHGPFGKNEFQLSLDRQPCYGLSRSGRDTARFRRRSRNEVGHA
jgi:hypothetical protein